jgi:hypothetical protein
MVTFTLPAEHARSSSCRNEIYRCSLTPRPALRLPLASPAGSERQRLHPGPAHLEPAPIFNPHLHAIVPGRPQEDGRVVSIPSASFLVPKAQVRRVFRDRFRAGLEALRSQQDLPAIDPRVWQRDWGVKLQPFGDGQNAIKYLGAYVARAAIGDSRIRSITATHVAFTWKDRAHGDVICTETVTGGEFVARYLRHVLPRGLKAVRHYGFCHPAPGQTRARRLSHRLAVARRCGHNPLQCRPRRPVFICPCCGP